MIGQVTSRCSNLTADSNGSDSPLRLEKILLCVLFLQLSQFCLQPLDLLLSICSKLLLPLHLLLQLLVDEVELENFLKLFVLPQQLFSPLLHQLAVQHIDLRKDRVERFPDAAEQ